MFLFVVALFITKARTAWISFILLLVIASSLAKKYIFLLVVLSLVVLLLPFYVDRFIELQGVIDYILEGKYAAEDHTYVVSNAFEWRLLHWYRLVMTGLEQPILGYGPGMVEQLNIFGLTAHNSFIEIFVEQGIVGMIAFFCLIGSIWVYLAQHVIYLDSVGQGLVIGMCIAVVLAMTFGQGVFNQTHNMQMFMLSLAVVRTLAKQKANVN